MQVFTYEYRTTFGKRLKVTKVTHISTQILAKSERRKQCRIMVLCFPTLNQGKPPTKLQNPILSSKMFLAFRYACLVLVCFTRYLY